MAAWMHPLARGPRAQPSLTVDVKPVELVAYRVPACARSRRYRSTRRRTNSAARVPERRCGPEHQQTSFWRGPSSLSVTKRMAVARKPGPRDARSR